MMPRPFSLDLRIRVILLALLQNHTSKSISRLLYMSTRTVERYLRRYYFANGSIGPEKARHGPSQLLTSYEQFLLVKAVVRRPSAYLSELADELENVTGRVVSVPTLCRVLKRLNFSRKIIRHIPTQRSEEARQRYIASTVHCPNYSPDMFVFLDESGFDRRNVIRRYGYAVLGKRPIDQTFFARGKRINVISAISSNGVLDACLYEKNVNGPCFLDFLRKYILPQLLPFDGCNSQSIVVMDNAAIHHVREVADLFRGVGVFVKFLPPYSPDLNPIEEVFSKVKYHIKANVEGHVEGNATTREMIVNAFAAVTQGDCISYMEHSGYV